MVAPIRKPAISHSKKTAAAFAISLLLLAGLAGAISSEQAKERASPYLQGSGEAVVVGAYNPLEYKADRYWIVYFAPQDSPNVKGIIFAVNDEDAGIETRQAVLTDLYSIDYDTSLLSFPKERKIAYSDLKAILDVAKEKLRRNAHEGLDSIKSQTADYSKISFSGIEVALDHLDNQANAVFDSVQEGADWQRDFESTLDVKSLNTTLDLYPKTWDKVSAFAKKASEFQKLVSEKQVEVLKSDFHDTNTLYKSLEAMKDIGMDQSFDTFLEARRSEYEVRLSKKAVDVNDSVSSFYYRKARVDARAAHSTASDRIETILGPQYAADLDACGIKTKDLKTKWEAVKFVVTSTGSTTDQYAKIPGQINEVNLLVDEANSDLGRCVKGSPTPKPKEFNAQEYLNPLLMVAFLGIVVYGVYRFRKQQEKMNSGEEY